MEQRLKHIIKKLDVAEAILISARNFDILMGRVAKGDVEEGRPKEVEDYQVYKVLPVDPFPFVYRVDCDPEIRYALTTHPVPPIDKFKCALKKCKGTKPLNEEDITEGVASFYCTEECSLFFHRPCYDKHKVLYGSVCPGPCDGVSRSVQLYCTTEISSMECFPIEIVPEAAKNTEKDEEKIRAKIAKKQRQRENRSRKKREAAEAAEAEAAAAMESEGAGSKTHQCTCEKNVQLVVSLQETGVQTASVQMIVVEVQTEVQRNATPAVAMREVGTETLATAMREVGTGAIAFAVREVGTGTLAVVLCDDEVQTDCLKEFLPSEITVGQYEQMLTELHVSRSRELQTNLKMLRVTANIAKRYARGEYDRASSYLRTLGYLIEALSERPLLREALRGHARKYEAYRDQVHARVEEIEGFHAKMYRDLAGPPGPERVVSVDVDRVAEMCFRAEPPVMEPKIAGSVAELVFNTSLDWIISTTDPRQRQFSQSRRQQQPQPLKYYEIYPPPTPILAIQSPLIPYGNNDISRIWAPANPFPVYAPVIDKCPLRARQETDAAPPVISDAAGRFTSMCAEHVYITLFAFREKYGNFKALDSDTFIRIFEDAIRYSNSGCTCAFNLV